MQIRIILAIFLLLAGGIGSASAQTAKQLRIGVDGTYPPFSHRNIDGEFSGLDIDIANALCKAMKVKCTFVQFKWDNLVAALRGKKIDLVIASIPIDEQGRELVDFSHPYLQFPSAVIVRKDSIVSGLDSEDLSDVRLGALKSSPDSEYMRTHLPDTAVKRYENEEEYFLDLANRRLDGVIGNPVSLHNWLQSEDGSKCCRMLGTLPHDPQINGEGVAVVVRKDEDKLLKKVNKALKSIDASGTRAKIIRAYLPFLK